MIRFFMYVILFAAGAFGFMLLVLDRRTATPRMLAWMPAFALTAVWGAYNAIRILVFWLGNAWWKNPPISSSLATMATAIILSWALTGLIVILDKGMHRHG